MKERTLWSELTSLCRSRQVSSDFNRLERAHRKKVVVGRTKIHGTLSVSPLDNQPAQAATSKPRIRRKLLSGKFMAKETNQRFPFMKDSWHYPKREEEGILARSACRGGAS